MIEIFAAYPHQIETGKLVALGMLRHGVHAPIVQVFEKVKADTVVCWGWRFGERFRSMGKNVLVMERGYVGDRFLWTSLGWNGLNGRAKFPHCTDGGERWNQHFPDVMKPWRPPAEDGPIWLIGQVSSDAAVRKLHYREWVERTAKSLKVHGRQIVFRPHPRSLEIEAPYLPHGCEVDKGPLEDALDRAAWMVTLNSNTAVVAALAGVPVVAYDSGSMAWPIAGLDTTHEPKMLAREPWAHQLAWCQWLPEELADGTAWAALKGVELD